MQKYQDSRPHFYFYGHTFHGTLTDIVLDMVLSVALLAMT